MSTSVPAIRPAMPLPSASAQPGGATASLNGARSMAATAVESARPVIAATAPERTVAAREARTSETRPEEAVPAREERRQPAAISPDRSQRIEAARAQALAAHRFYEMTSLLVGKNPLNDPVP